MPDTFTQLLVHIVFGTRDRANQISESWEANLHKYIAMIVQERGHRMIQINGMPDHLHLLIGLNPRDSISSLVREVKQGSCLWINRGRFVRGKFHWQEGFGAFSHSNDALPRLVRYISNQKEHHRDNRSFADEFVVLLDESGVEYNPSYLP